MDRADDEDGGSRTRRRDLDRSSKRPEGITCCGLRPGRATTNGPTSKEARTSDMGREGQRRHRRDARLGSSSSSRVILTPGGAPGTVLESPFGLPRSGPRGCRTRMPSTRPSTVQAAVMSSPRCSDSRSRAPPARHPPKESSWRPHTGPLSLDHRPRGGVAGPARRDPRPRCAGTCRGPHSRPAPRAGRVEAGGVPVEGIVSTRHHPHGRRRGDPPGRAL
jgi:hypothetical protein